MFGRITATMLAGVATAGIVAAGVGLTGAASAGAQPASAGSCTTMTMASGQGGQVPNSMTRAGQILAASGPAPSSPRMPANCQPASHG